MIEHVAVGIGIFVLVLLVLPFRWIQKVVLECGALVLRLALFALIVAGGVAWFRPSLIPNDVMNILADWQQQLGGWAAEMQTKGFVATVAGMLVLALVPILMVFDVTRQLAGRLRRIRELSATETQQQQKASDNEQKGSTGKAQSQSTNVNSSAEAMASAAEGRGRPNRVADYLK